MHYAMEKGQYEQVTSDATLSLKSAAAKGAMENLMFDPEHYKCHHEVNYNVLSVSSLLGGSNSNFHFYVSSFNRTLL